MARLAAAGALGAGGLSGFMSRALAKGDLPAIPGVNQLKGTATVNGRAAAVGTPVTARDKVSTGPGSMAVVVIKDDAFLIRENTTLEFGESRGTLSRILVQTGRVLSVFGKKPVAIKARNATIGIRGTGAYLEVDPEQGLLLPLLRRGRPRRARHERPKDDQDHAPRVAPGHHGPRRRHGARFRGRS